MNKVDIDAQIDFFQGTLMLIVRNKNFDIVKKLRNFGADVRIGNYSDGNEMTQLAFIVKNNNLRIVELLVDSGAKFASGIDTVPMALIFYRNEPIVELLKTEIEIEFKEENAFLNSYIYYAIKGTPEIIKTIWPYYPGDSALWLHFL